MKKTLRFLPAFAPMALFAFALVGTALAQGPRGGHNGSMVGHHPRTGQPNYRPTTPSGPACYTPPPPPPPAPAYYSTCHAPLRQWVPGHWRTNAYGQQMWVPGHWRVRSGAAWVVAYDPAPAQVLTYQPTMGPYEFQGAMAHLRRLSFESSRAAAARQMLDNHLFTSAQVRELLSVFAFENTRVELAQYAYLRTVDPQNYYTVYGAFQFASSAHALDAYISRL